ncbi:MAG TPA: hypothetical protein VF395_19355 [Polyangiaceae bacterium]
MISRKGVPDRAARTFAPPPSRAPRRGQTAAEYAAHMEDNLRSLLDRAKSGDRYHAPPVRRVHIPKNGRIQTVDH